jgi:hypothetical protein
LVGLVGLFGLFDLFGLSGLFVWGFFLCICLPCIDAVAARGSRRLEQGAHAGGESARLSGAAEGAARRGECAAQGAHCN